MFFLGGGGRFLVSEVALYLVKEGPAQTRLKTGVCMPKRPVRSVLGYRSGRSPENSNYSTLVFTGNRVFYLT